MKKILLFIIIPIISLLHAQSDKVQVGEQSDMSKMLKSSGSLLLKESYSLPNIKTTYGNDIEASIYIIDNMLSDESNPQLGLRLSLKGEYSTKRALIDFDELEGLLSSINIIQEKRMSLCTNPSIEIPEDSDNSTEIDYISKDGFKFGAYVGKKNKLKYAVQVSRTADWAFLKDAGVETLKENINTVMNIKK